MKQQAHFSEKLVQLMASKTWDQLNAAEKATVLREVDQATFENYRCLIGVSRALHQETPAPSTAIKDRFLAHLQQRRAQTRKKAFWADWFQWEVPVWQVSLASLAFVLLYLSGVPGDTADLDANSADQLFFQGPVDTVYLDTEQAPEDSSDQRQPLLESHLFHFLPSWLPAKAEPVVAQADRSLLALAISEDKAHLLPPTQAMLSTQQIIPLELLEIRG